MTDSSTPTPDSLKERLQTLQDRLQDLDAADISQQLQQDADQIASRIHEARSAGYAYLAALEAELPELRGTLNLMGTRLSRELGEHREAIERDMKQAQQALMHAIGGNPALLTRTTQELDEVDAKLKTAEQAFESHVQPVEQAIGALRGRLDQIERTLKLKAEASFEFEPGEHVVLAEKAEWVETGKGKDDPDGILFLTSLRLIFEQKERTGKVLGMFGGKKQQGLEWAVTLEQIASMETANKGMFGGKDMLTLKLTPGSDHAELLLEIKGGGDNQHWQTSIEQVRQGTYGQPVGGSGHSAAHGMTLTAKLDDN